MAHIPRPVIDQTIELAMTIIEQYQLIRTFDTVVSEVHGLNIHITEDQIREYVLFKGWMTRGEVGNG